MFTKIRPDLDVIEIADRAVASDVEAGVHSLPPPPPRQAYAAPDTNGSDGAQPQSAAPATPATGVATEQPLRTSTLSTRRGAAATLALPHVDSGALHDDAPHSAGAVLLGPRVAASSQPNTPGFIDDRDDASHDARRDRRTSDSAGVRAATQPASAATASDASGPTVLGAERTPERAFTGTALRASPSTASNKSGRQRRSRRWCKRCCAVLPNSCARVRRAGGVC